MFSGGGTLSLVQNPVIILSNLGINSIRCPRRERPLPRLLRPPRSPRPASGGGPSGRPLALGGPSRRNDSRAASRSSSSSSPSLFLSKRSKTCWRSASRSGRPSRPGRSAGCAERLAFVEAIRPNVRNNRINMVFMYRSFKPPTKRRREIRSERSKWLQLYRWIKTIIRSARRLARRLAANIRLPLAGECVALDRLAIGQEKDKFN